MISFPKRNVQGAWSTKVFGVNTSVIFPGAMNGQIDLLPDADLLIGQAHHQERTIRVGGVVPARFIAIFLRIDERFPRQGEAKLGGTQELRIGGDHFLDVSGVPQSIFKARILEDLRHETSISRIGDRFQETAENSSGNAEAGSFCSVDVDGHYI